MKSLALLVSLSLAAVLALGLPALADEEEHPAGQQRQDEPVNHESHLPVTEARTDLAARISASEREALAIMRLGVDSSTRAGVRVIESKALDARLAARERELLDAKTETAAKYFLFEVEVAKAAIRELHEKHTEERRAEAEGHDR